MSKDRERTNRTAYEAPYNRGDGGRKSDNNGREDYRP